MQARTRREFLSEVGCGALAAALGAGVLAEDERFNITRFQIEGNTLLPDAELQRAVAPLTGPGRVYGDVHPDVVDVAGFVSPNPGGVGPMTVALLMTNVVEAAERTVSV